MFDLGFGRFQFRLFLFQSALQIGGIELYQYISIFYDGAGADQLDNLQVATHGRRSMELKGADGFDAAPNGDVIYEITLAGFCGCHRRIGNSSKRQATDRKHNDCGHEQHDVSPPAKGANWKQVSHQLEFLSRTAPGSIPESITCSWSLALPIWTSRLSKPAPLFTRTK